LTNSLIRGSFDIIYCNVAFAMNMKNKLLLCVPMLLLCTGVYSKPVNKMLVEESKTFSTWIDHNSFKGASSVTWFNRIKVFGDFLFNYSRGTVYRLNNGETKPLAVKGQSLQYTYINIGVHATINKATYMQLGLSVEDDWIATDLAAKADTSGVVASVSAQNKLLSISYLVKEAYFVHKIGNVYIKGGRYFVPFGYNPSPYEPMHTFTQSLTQLSAKSLEVGLKHDHMMMSLFTYIVGDNEEDAGASSGEVSLVNNLAYGGGLFYKDHFNKFKYMLQFGFLSYVADIVHARDYNADDHLISLGIARSMGDDLKLEQQGFAYHITTKMKYLNYEFLVEYTTYGDTHFISQNDADLGSPIVISGLWHVGLAYDHKFLGQKARLYAGAERPINKALLPLRRSLYLGADWDYMKNVRLDVKYIANQGTEAYNKERYNQFILLGMHLTF
jgi:hypothetical protein